MPGPINRQLLKRLWYMPILAAAMALMLIRLLIVARLLPVEEFAVYSLGLLVSSSFCMLGCMGLQSLLQRDLPVMIVRRREKAGGVLLMQSVLVAIATAVAAVSALAISEAPVFGISSRTLSIALIHGLSQQLFTVATVDSRSRSLPVRYANQNFFRAVLLTLIGPIAIGFGNGAVTVLALEAGLTLLVSAWLIFDKFRAISFPFAAAIIVALRCFRSVRWKSAIILLMVGTLSFVAGNLDRWIAAQWLSANSFGIYSFAWTLFIVAQAAQLIINAAAYPIISRVYAVQGTAAAFRISAAVSMSLLVVSALSGLLAYPILEQLIRSFYPSYANSIQLLPLFILASVLRVSDFWSSYLVVTRKESQLLWLTLSTITIILTTWWIYADFNMRNLSISHVAYLALLLAIGTYLSVALAAWAASRVSSKEAMNA